MNDEAEQIVISGAGLVTAHGLTREHCWQSILQGQNAMRVMTAIESPLPAGMIGGQAMDLPEDFNGEMPREARYLRWAIADAMRDAKVDLNRPGDPRMACLLGTTLHGMRAAGRFFRGGDYSSLRDFLAGNTMQTALSGLPVAGLTATTCSACSSSLASISLGITLLQTGEADMVIAGGYDAISEYVYAGFNSLRLIAEGAMKPFTRGRQGMKVAEGYGIVVLERAGDAMGRGAMPLAAVLGWGESSDAHHLTQPHPEGDGAARAIENAIGIAGLSAGEIDLVAAHATGTPDNDSAEFAALSKVFGERLAVVPVVAFKSHLGHTLGGAGAVELILSAMALRDQIVPATANVEQSEIEFPQLNLAIGKPRPGRIERTHNTSLGFGGANASMILGKAESKPAIKSARPRQDVFVSGIGVVLPGVVGNDALVARLNSSGDPAWARGGGRIDETDLAGLLSARRVRRMSDYVKILLAAATLACRDAGVDEARARESAAIVGTMHGSVNYSWEFYKQIINEGLSAANPMLFAESVPNAGSAQLSLMLSIKGSCQSIIGTRTAGLDAIALATARIRSGDWRRAFVGAGEEFCEPMNEVYGRCGMASSEGCAPFAGETGFVPGAGAVVFILESSESIEQRGGKRLARIDATAAHFGGRAGVVKSIGEVLERLGHPANILSSACGTWIDRAEAAAIETDGAARRVSSVYGHLRETFSVSPLAGLAGTILSRRMSALFGAAHSAQTEETINSVAAICTDFTGAVSGARISII